MEQQTTFWRDGERLAPTASPTAAFDAIFAGAPAASSRPEGMSAADRRRRSVLDRVRRELAVLETRVGAEERRKLELHAASIRTLEERLFEAESSPGAGCEPADTIDDSPELLERNARCLDLGIAAMSCDLTRVVAVEFGHHQSTQVGLPGMSPGDWHNLYIHSHRVEDLTKLEAWIAERFVRAIERSMTLPAPDGNGTLFDQTLFAWVRTMGDAVAHTDADMRAVLVSGSDYLRKAPEGRHLDAGGAPHQQLLFTLGDAMGVTSGEFGNPTRPRSPLPGVAA